MANPFGITQVDVPGLLGMHQQMKQQRLEDLYKAKQIEREDRKLEREDKRDIALAKVFQPKGGDPSSGSAGEAPTLVPGQPMPPRTDGLTINHDALNELYAIDPQQAIQVQKMVYDADKQHLERVQSAGSAMAQAAYYLRSVPADQRAGELQRIAPQLLAQGVSQDALAQADVSDAGLDRAYKLGSSMKDLISQEAADRKFKADEADRARDNARQDAGLDVQRGNLALSRQREARVTKWGPQPLFGLPGGARSDTDDLNY
jgi:hypothetical protein